MSVQFIGALIWQGQLGIVMELMEGGDLQRALATEVVSWTPLGMQIAQDIACGLVYLHSRNILHLVSCSKLVA